MPKDKYDCLCTDFNDSGAIVASETTKTAISSKYLDIKSFVRVPNRGEYILSKCKTKAYRVVRLQHAKACGSIFQVVFVADPTSVLESNPHGAKGVEIDVHNRKCSSHCVTPYYLSEPKGHEINAELI